MMSLQTAWAYISRELYGEEFIEELAGFLQKQRVKNILECGCGDGHVVHGLAQRGFNGLGIDSDPEMFSLALKDNQHPNIKYNCLGWLNLGILKEQFDAVICRGNSLPCISGWGDFNVEPKKTREEIRKSIGLFFGKLKKGGLLYLDTCPEVEINSYGREIEINSRDTHLLGTISYEQNRQVRRIEGNGIIHGEPYQGVSTSLVIHPNELEQMVSEHSPSAVWHQKLVNENNYEVICAKK